MSKPHTSKTALQDACVCMFARLHVAIHRNLNGNESTHTFQSCTRAKALQIYNILCNGSTECDSVASGVREKGYYCSVGAGAKAIRVDQGKAGEASSLT